MNNESFVLYESVFKQTEILSKKLGKEAAFDFIESIMAFGLYGELPDEESAVWLYGFEQSITSISAAKTRYQAAIENGKKGGRKKSIDDTKVMDLKEKGYTNKQIAEELKCSVSSVEKIAAKIRKNQKNLNVNVNVNDNVNENVNDNVNDNINDNVNDNINNNLDKDLQKPEKPEKTEEENEEDVSGLRVIHSPYELYTEQELNIMAWEEDCKTFGQM